MTILAGVYSRDPRVHVADAVCESLRRIISRNPDDSPAEFRAARAYLVKVDIGAFGRPAHRVSAGGSVAMLAGEPLLTCAGPHSGERDAHLEYLHEQWDRGEFQHLRHASGTFCAAYYDPRTETARLFADRLGLRPLYYTVVNELVYFASALRILEALAEVPKTVDVLSVTETMSFGYPFGGGTPYAGIKMLQPCEIVTMAAAGVSSDRYFQWASIARAPQASEHEALKAIFEKFQSAVRRRLRGDKTVFANLSGGLDSRCVVAALRAEGTRVYTFNFSQPGTQDQVFGLEFAKKIGTTHQEVAVDPDPDWSATMAGACSATMQRREQLPERPNAVWSGEGGSVGLGHVYLSPDIVSRMRSGDEPGALAIFLRQQGKVIQTRILRPEVAARLHGYLHSRLRSEIAEIRCPDRLRALYIFLNLNGPRRHMEGHFNTIDQHRMEYQMPFNDSDLLEHVTSHAVEPFLYHQFYVQWLELFDPAVVAVPWQAYPGHVRSPIPIPEGVLDQWTSPVSLSRDKTLRQDLLERSAAMLSDRYFPDAVLSKRNLRWMWWAWKLNLSRYDYTLRLALIYWQYGTVAEGRYDLSRLSAIIEPPPPTPAVPAGAE